MGCAPSTNLINLPTYLQKGLAISQTTVTGMLDTRYTKAEIEAAAQYIVGRGNHIYISCKPDPDVPTNYLLYEIYVCMDVFGRNNVSCPLNADKKGCAQVASRQPVKIKIPR